MSDTGTLVSLDDLSEGASSVVLDYTSRDFTAIRAQLIGLAKGIMPDWEPVGEASDFGTLILELFAYMGDVLHYYIDRTAAEAFLSTAQRRQSLLYISDMLGYTPVGQHAAIVTLTFTLDPEATENVTLARGTKVHNESSTTDEMIVFETEFEITLEARDPAAGESNPRVKTVQASEGISVLDWQIGTSSGVPGQDFTIPEKGVIYQTLSVVTREGFTTTSWDFTSDLSLARPTQASFTTYLDEEDMTHIVFGDNAAGRIPAVDAEIFATYRFGVGAEANDIDVNALTTIIPVDATDISYVSVTNTEVPVGGADPEKIESMRNSISRGATKLKSRAVTLNDYADLAMQVPGVGKAIAYGTVYTAVRIRIAPSSYGASPALMQNLCNTVESYMADKVLIGSNVYAEPTDFNKLFDDVGGTGNIYIRATVHVLSTYNRTAVRERVDSVIRGLLTYSNVTFGQRVTIGQVYRAMLSVQGVEWAELTWLSTESPVDAQTPAGGSTALTTGLWQYDNQNTLADPGALQYRTDVPASPTWFAFSKTAVNNVDRSSQLLGLQIGDQIVWRPSATPSQWMVFIVQSAPIDNVGSPGWVRVNVALANQASGTISMPGPNQNVLFDFFRPVPAPPVQGVFNIETPELLLPRIEPTEVVEDVNDYVDWSEAERTHDGLWVWAVGGMTDT